MREKEERERERESARKRERDKERERDKARQAEAEELRGSLANAQVQYQCELTSKCFYLVIEASINYMLK